MEEAAHDRPSRDRTPFELARAHPVLTVLGAAGLGLLGGVELAAGVLIGAGVLAAIRARRTPAHADGTVEVPPPRAGATARGDEPMPSGAV